MALSGIKYVVDEKGRKTAAIVDLRKYRDAWEDFYDYLLCLEMEKQPRESLAVAEKKLREAGKLSG